MGYESQIESGLFLDRHVSLIVHRSHMCIFACRVRLGADAGCDPYSIARGGAGGGTYEARAAAAAARASSSFTVRNISRRAHPVLVLGIITDVTA